MVALQSEDRVVLALPQALIIQEVWVIRPELLIAHGGKHAPQSCVCVCVHFSLGECAKTYEQRQNNELTRPGVPPTLGTRNCA